MNRRALLLSGLSLAVLTGAGPRRTYLKQHRGHTRKLVLYHDFSTALLLRATLLTPAFRAALAEERRRLLDPTDDNHAEFVARMERDGAAYHEVVFAADSALENADRFGPGDDRWNVRLEVDGRVAPLVEVSRVRAPSPLHEALYVQHDPWSELWIARFERVAERPAEVVLHVGSGFGHGEVRWSGLGG